MITLPQTITCRVPFRRRVSRHWETPATPIEAAPEVPPRRVPRIARLMALALRFEQLLQAGAIRDYAELARLGHVSRARVSQIISLLNHRARLCSCVCDCRSQDSTVALSQVISNLMHEFAHARALVVARHMRV